MSETAEQVLTTEQVAYAIGSLRIFADAFKDGTDSDPCYDIDKIDAHIDALQSLTTQQAWDMRSLELTIEKLREENERLRAANTVLRSALTWALQDGGWRLWYYGWDMPDTIKAGLIGSPAEIDEDALERAVTAIIEGQSAALETEPAND